MSVYVSGEPGGVTDHWNGIGTVQGILEGTYVLKLTKNGYKDWVKQVSFGAGLTTTVYAYLETGTGNATTRDEVISPASLLGSLEVDTTPKGVNIYVGGEFGGTTDSRGATVQGIPEGTYVLRLRKAGYPDWVAQVNVTAGLTTTVKATLALLQCKADFSVDLTRVPVGAAVRFTDLSTGSVESWLWDFGDGQTSTERNPTHIYRREGTYTVSLIVANKAGNNTVRKGGYVTVYDKPRADFSFSPAQIAVGNSISFTDRSTGTVASWLWDFGDGSTSTEQNPIHFYRTGGNYTVSLTASNLAGSDTMRKERCVRVYASEFASTILTISVASVLMAAYAVILRTALRRNPEPKASPDRT